EDRDGLEESRQSLVSLIENEMANGIPAQRIILMGFSQGGAVVLYSGLRCAHKLAGIGALSTYLPLADRLGTEKQAANADVPVFMAHGQYDPVVRYEWGEKSCQLLQQQGYGIDWHSYPMEHSVCMEEVGDIARWLSRCLSTD
ncbi:alpha/beta hydrolase, partial [Kaarinaea lacus]